MNGGNGGVQLQIQVARGKSSSYLHWKKGVTDALLVVVACRKKLLQTVCVVLAATWLSNSFGAVTENNNLFAKAYHLHIVSTNHSVLSLSNNTTQFHQQRHSHKPTVFSSRCECLQVLFCIHIQMLKCVSPLLISPQSLFP